MRIAIREQLALLLLLASAIGLGVISLATWYTNYSFVLNLRSTRLAITASLKASQVGSWLALMENSVEFVASRVIVQDALQNYIDTGDNNASNWAAALLDMEAAIGGPASGGAVGTNLLLQSQIFPVNASGPAGGYSLINTTNSAILGKIALPYAFENGSTVYLGDEGLGYPPEVYPNFTYTTTEYEGVIVAEANYKGAIISPAASGALMIGPWVVNSTFAILSITIPIINNTSSTNVLGWLTVVMDARLISDVIESTQGLDATGEMLLVRPENSTNQYPAHVMYDDAPEASVYDNVPVKFILPLAKDNAVDQTTEELGTDDPAFNMSSFKAIIQAVTEDNGQANNAGSEIRAYNEEGLAVSCGYALVNVSFVDWAVIIQEDRSEVWEPIIHLRIVILACLFGTLAAMVIAAWPLAHFVSRPIRELRTATAKSIKPYGYNDSSESLNHNIGSDDLDGSGEIPTSNFDPTVARKEGFIATVLRRRKGAQSAQSSERKGRFRIPGKVPERKHIFRDELTELTSTFNEMSDELTMQYERLEERVQQRTAELEVSKKAAEAANESKTLFIANISHELKTPLNGILGMCAVCMQEEDPIRLKRSLGIIYKSGDLLLNLLTDLLTFSKNQVGQQLSLDEKEFRLRDVSTQILAIFDKQARDSQIDLTVQFMKGNELDTKATAAESGGLRVKDMILWGDTHRILQVIINLVSNSLKFTPAHGKVTLTVRCLSEQIDVGSRKGSLGSKASRRMSSRAHFADGSPHPGRSFASVEGSSNVEKGAFQRITELERVAPPPGKMLMFEFEVVDTGPGIPEHQHQQIFEPFVQGDLGLSKKYGGTGLGLSICNQLAGLMNGTMHIKSEVGQGSTFSLNIPLRHLLSRADSTASSSASLSGDATTSDGHVRTTSGDVASVSPVPDGEQASQPRLVGLSHPFFASTQLLESPGSQPAAMDQITAAASSSGRIRVLVAEDNKVNQEVVLRMLKLEDIYDVTVAKDGQEALDVVKESMAPNSKTGQFNLIFMDVQMPNLDGLQSTKLIREIGFDAPIVALTAFAEESNVKDCLASGMNYFLSKPIRRPALKKVLKEYCTPIQELDEEAATPSEKKSNEEVPSSRLSKSSKGSVDLGMPNGGNTTVLVLSRPNSVEVKRGSIEGHIVTV